MSTQAMTGVVKVGMTLRTPEIRLKEANAAFGIRPGWRIDVAKKVSNVRQKEALLKRILAPHRVPDISAREQFTVSVNTVAELFALMDGEIWTPRVNRRVQPTEPFEGHVYNTNFKDEGDCIIHGMRIKYTERSLFPTCKIEGCNCKDLNLSPFVKHLHKLDKERRDQHNSRFPRPIVRKRGSRI
jgi:hypothetical protein